MLSRATHWTCPPQVSKQSILALMLVYLLTVATKASIVSVASDMADDMMAFYTGDQPGQTPGLLPEPYYCELSHLFPSCQGT